MHWVVWRRIVRVKETRQMQKAGKCGLRLIAFAAACVVATPMVATGTVIDYTWRYVKVGSGDSVEIQGVLFY